MLVEAMHKEIEDCEVIQANTDGVTFRIKRVDEEKLMKVCNEWEVMTKLELEYAYYEKMIMRDVNNYIAVYTPEEVDFDKFTKYSKKYEYYTYCSKDEKYYASKIKHKGCFEIDRAWNKNHSMKIVQIALSDYFVKGIPIEDTIYNCDNIYHFCLGSKTKRAWKSVLRSVYNGDFKTEELQKTNRYYISKKGGTLMRLCEDGRETNVQKGHKVRIFNDYYLTEEFTNYQVDHMFYIKEARKVINTIEGTNQLTLF
jgi:hypothetical protein